MVSVLFFPAQSTGPVPSSWRMRWMECDDGWNVMILMHDASRAWSCGSHMCPGSRACVNAVCHIHPSSYKCVNVVWHPAWQLQVYQYVVSHIRPGHSVCVDVVYLTYSLAAAYVNAVCFTCSLAATLVVMQHLTYSLAVVHAWMQCVSHMACVLYMA